MTGLGQDLRDAVRTMRRSPGATASTVLILGLAIAANAVILTVAETLFFRRLPVPRADGLARVSRIVGDRRDGGFSWPEYRYLRDRATAFESLAAHYSYAPLVVDTPDGAQEAQGAAVSASYFEMLGVRPELGRFFRPDEDAVPDRDAVAVVADRWWRERLGADPGILGRVLRVNGMPFTVVGVAPEGFTGVHPESPNELWIPTMMLRVGYRWGDALGGAARPLEILGRLASGCSLAQARAQLAAVAPGLAGAASRVPPLPALTADRATGLDPANRRALLPSMRLLGAISLLLLLVSCANVAALQSVRASARRKELAIRRSLGCGPARVARKLLIESLVIAAAAGAAGVGASIAARAGVLPFYTADSEGYVRAFPLALSGRVWAASIALALAGGLLAGVLPALQAAGAGLLDALKDDRGWTGSGRSRSRALLVVGQVALSFALVTAAVLLGRSALRIRSGDRFDPAHVALLRLRPRLAGVSAARAERYTAEVVRRLEATPGVRSVSLVRGSGLAWRQTGETSVASSAAGTGLRAGYHEVGPRFLATLGIPVVRGREFDSRDREGSPRVAVVNETLARTLWPEADALGRTIFVDGAACSVVGVFADAQLHPAGRPSPPFLYLSYWQFVFGHPVDSRLVVRVEGGPKALLERLRGAALAVDPSIPVTEVMAMSDQVTSSLSEVFLASRVASAAGLATLFLAGIGLHGLLSAILIRRRPEFALRMALGAAGSDIRALVARDTFRLVAAGIAAGTLLALAFVRTMRAFLFDAAGPDARSLAVSAAVLGASALLASWRPARRAARIDPAAALRAE